MATIDLFFADLLREVEEVVGPDGLRNMQLVESWPFGRGPEGPIRLGAGSLMHGAYARTVGDHLELLVANNGWPIEHTRCPGSMPPPLPVCGPSNYWTSAQGSLVEGGSGIGVVAPGDAVFDRVGARAKPLGLADTDRPEQARAWEAAAAAHGLACSVEQSSFVECGGSAVWFVSVARRERVAELVDLEALCAWYCHALVAAGLPHRVTTAVAGLEALAERCPADFLDRTDELVMVPMLDDDPNAVSSPVAGLLLGYWPPTTVALMASHADPARGEHVGRFPRWDQARHGLEAFAQELVL